MHLIERVLRELPIELVLTFCKAMFWEPRKVIWREFPLTEQIREVWIGEKPAVYSWRGSFNSVNTPNLTDENLAKIGLICKNDTMVKTGNEDLADLINWAVSLEEDSPVRHYVIGLAVGYPIEAVDLFCKEGIQMDAYKLDKIASQISSHPDFIELVTDELKNEYNIPLDQNPIEEGSRSAVYENSAGNIVIFTQEDGCNVAYESVGKDLTTFPEIYKLDNFDIPEDSNLYKKYYGFYKICIIEMEKLKILSQNERREIEDFANKERIFYHPDGFVERFEEIKAEGGTLSPLLESVLDLLNRSKKEKTLHLDFHPGNVGWGKDGKLKYIDLESIVFD